MTFESQSNRFHIQIFILFFFGALYFGVWSVVGRLIKCVVCFLSAQTFPVVIMIGLTALQSHCTININSLLHIHSHAFIFGALFETISFLFRECGQLSVCCVVLCIEVAYTKLAIACQK